MIMDGCDRFTLDGAPGPGGIAQKVRRPSNNPVSKKLKGSKTIFADKFMNGAVFLYAFTIVCHVSFAVKEMVL